MANNNNMEEYLVYLKENAYELRKLGKEWGMTEEEIDNCVTEALSAPENREKLKNSPKNTARKWWSYFLFLVKFHLTFGFLLFAVFSIVYVTASYHEPTQRAIISTLMPYSYSILRMIRLAAVPIHGMFNISSLYNAECLIDNPYYEDVQPDCNLCRNYKFMKDYNASQFSPVKFSAHINMYKPVKIENSLPKNVTYSDLRKLYLEIKDGLYMDPHQFTSSAPELGSLSALFDEDRQKEIDSHEALHIDWYSTTVKASAGLRTLFPRPRYLPPETEITLEKHVLVDGPNTDTYHLPASTTSALQLFMLGSGKRRVLVRPVQACKEHCNSMLAFLKPGDALLYNRDLWRVYMATNGNVTSVGYLISILM